MSRRKRQFGEAHVRLYRHELESLAWQTLSVDARALLVELRALFDPRRGDNRVFLSIRKMMRRLGIGQRRVEAARDALLERGWITIAELGSFTRKVLHATVYALENEAPSNGAGSVPSKAYMRWRPPAESDHGSHSASRSGAKKAAIRSAPQPSTRKNTVAVVHANGSRGDYRPPPSGLSETCPDGSRHEYRSADILPPAVAASATQIRLPRGCGEHAGLLATAMMRGVPDDARVLLLAAWLASLGVAEPDATAVVS